MEEDQKPAQHLIYIHGSEPHKMDELFAKCFAVNNVCDFKCKDEISDSGHRSGLEKQQSVDHFQERQVAGADAVGAEQLIAAERQDATAIQRQRRVLMTHCGRPKGSSARS